jgi:glutathione S-transferase
VSTGRPVVVGYNWAPDRGMGLVRDMRVRWALEEVGVAYDERHLDWGEQKAPEHRARNPFGQVPAYEEDGLVLFESGAIVLHIARRWPGLLPTDPAAQERAVQWLFAALNTVEPVVWDRVIAVIVDGQQPWAQDRLPGVLERLHVRLGELSVALGDNDWLDGGFSVGDLMMVQVLRHVNDAAILGAYPNLAAYVERGMARPAFHRALERLRTGLTGQPPANWPH